MNGYPQGVGDHFGDGIISEPVHICFFRIGHKPRKKSLPLVDTLLRNPEFLGRTIPRCLERMFTNKRMYRP